MKIKFDKIPYILKNVPLAKETAISPIIPALEGTIVAVEAQDHEGKLNVLDFKSGYLGRLWKKDRLPAVLGYRKATSEFAGYIPSNIKAGDELYLLC